MTTARTSGSRASFNASRRPAWSARLNAFITSGRLSVIVCTAPSRVTSTSAMRRNLSGCDRRRSDPGQRCEVCGCHLVAEEDGEAERAEVLEERHVLRCQVVVVDADDRM